MGVIQAIYKEGRVVYCIYCGKSIAPINFSRDHLVPRSKGGTGHPANIRPCCRPCNNEKGNLSLERYRALIRTHSDSYDKEIKLANIEYAIEWRNRNWGLCVKQDYQDLKNLTQPKVSSTPVSEPMVFALAEVEGLRAQVAELKEELKELKAKMRSGSFIDYI